jgi:xylose dehydrogenase (NAD/NADP)
MSLESYLSGFHERDWEETTDGTTRFALIGLGWWTVDEAIPAIAASDHCETTVLVSSSTEKAQGVAADAQPDATGISYDQFHDGVATDDYDAVYVGTPNALHLPYVRSAAEFGKDVLCEKPMEATTERAEQLVETCADHGVQLAVGYRMQTEPAVRRARELIRERVIGEPRYVHGANYQRLFDINPNEDQWRLSADLSGYGTSVMDLGIYPLNTARFLLDADPVSAQATMRSTHPAFEDVPDEHASFTLTFENDVLAACTTSQNAHGTDHLEITGTEGRIRFDPAFHMETDLSVTVGEETVTFDTSEVNQMTEVFDYAGYCFANDEPVAFDGEHGLVDMRAIEAIHEAAESGDRVEIPK